MNVLDQKAVETLIEKGAVIGDLEILPGMDPKRFRLGRSIAFAGEGSWCVTYKTCCEDGYKLVAGFLFKKSSDAILKRCQQIASGDQLL